MSTRAPVPDPWLDPLLVIDGRYRFQHGPEDVAAAREFVGPVEAADGSALARAIVLRVHERMRILPTAFGLGMPKTLRAIVAAGGGNCVSHAVLAAVLLRDRGLPTRLVAEEVHTNFGLLRAPTVFVRAPVGPTLNGHVWIEVLLDGEWVPADAELGIFGVRQWLRVRLGTGVTVAALGVAIRERWKFPLRIRRLGPDGMPEEDVTGLYLVEKLAGVLGPAAALPSSWVEGVRYFSRSFRWEGRAGLRILRERRRLREMSRALASFSGELQRSLAGTAERRKEES